MARKALILVEGHRGNGPLHVQAAERLGFNPITLSADLAQCEYLAAESVELPFPNLGEWRQRAGPAGFAGAELGRMDISALRIRRREWRVSEQARVVK
ncbi:hypothetical protein NKH93_33675 [Mesorhizobium sp. M0954]|uniref:hypothetical protein n=1 Tax=Mesorhizobium sp. M0954 TaxID=2957032 RepID=UPI003339D067